MKKSIKIYGALILLFICALAFSGSTREGVLRQATVIWYALTAGGEIAQSSSNHQLVSTVGEAWIDAPGARNQLQSGFLNDGLFAEPAAASIAISAPSGQTTVAVGDMLPITWQTTGDVQNVNIELSRNNGATWETLFANTPNDGEIDWRTTRPRSDGCLIRISDLGGVAQSVRSGTFAIAPARAGEIQKPSAQPGGSLRTAYRMVSVPLDLDNAAIRSVLEDDFAVYDTTKWRFFDRRNDAYAEFPGTRNFSPGRSFFLITATSGITLDAGPGFYVADSVVSVELDDGWNMVANPFHDFNLPVTAIEPSGLDFMTYNGSWSSPASQLTAWEGYMVKVSGPTTLKMRLPDGFGKTRAVTELQSRRPEEWQIQIVGQADVARDDANFAGVRYEARDGFDDYDFYEPPPIGEYVSVYFPHDDSEGFIEKYSGDFRTLGAQNYEWDFEARSNIQGVVQIRFDGLRDLPSNFEARLIDPALNIALDLRQERVYEYVNRGARTGRPFKLVVGDVGFVDRRAEEYEALPIDFELSQNFPNPFNPSTTIRYSLAKNSVVTLRILDVLGKSVAVLLSNETKPAGRHAVIWDATNESGARVPSGVYLYELRTSEFVKVRKMALAK